MSGRDSRGCLVRNRERMDRDVKGLSRRHLSAGFRAHHDAIIPELEQLVAEEVIDLGAGDSPFADIIASRAQRYDTLDVTTEKQPVTYVSDIQHMPEVPSERYDVAVCLQVLEHVPNPGAALRESHRILRPGGHLILSVPHLSRLHDEPHDYYRYTNHGLTYLAKQAGFCVEKVIPYGSVFSFLGHQVSTLLLTLCWGIPGLRELVRLLNRMVLVWPCALLDRIGPLARLAPLGYVAVLRVPKGSIESED